MGAMIPLLVVPDTKLLWCSPKTSQNVLQILGRWAWPPHMQRKIPTLKMPFFPLNDPFFSPHTPGFSQVSVCSLSSTLFSLLLHTFIFPFCSQGQRKNHNSS